MSRKDTNLILNEIVTDGVVTVRQDTNSIMNAVYSEEDGAIKVNVTNLPVDGSSKWEEVPDSPVTQIQPKDGLHIDATVVDNIDADMVEDTTTTNKFVTAQDKIDWSAKQDALEFTPEDVANKGTNNGYCGLDAGGKVPLTNLPSTLLVYKGVWNAAANTPTLIAADTDKKGWVYNVSAAGTQSGIDFSLGDWAIYNDAGNIEKSDNSDDVVSVNSQQGVVNLDADDIDDSETTNKFTSISEKSTWSAKQDDITTVEVILDKDDWTVSDSYYTQTIAVTGATTTNKLIITHKNTRVDKDLWSLNGVMALSQTTDSVTFQTEEIPLSDINVNVMIIN